MADARSELPRMQHQVRWSHDNTTDVRWHRRTCSHGDTDTAWQPGEVGNQAKVARNLLFRFEACIRRESLLPLHILGGMTARCREEHVSPRESWKKQEAVYLLVGQPKQARKAASARATCHLALLAVCAWSILFQHISSVIYCCTICRRRCAPENDTIRACLASPCATISEQ